MTRVVGITGGIGTGKSTVAAMFAALGAAGMDADALARAAVAPGCPAYEEIVARFGRRFVRADGTLDRGALADLVFRDADARRDLEGIVHPHVTQALREEIAALRRSPNAPPLVVVEIPLLYEAGLEWLVEKTVVVSSEQGTQLERLKTRTGMTPEQAMLRVAAQMPLQEKERRADYVIRTDGSLEDVRQQVRRVWDDLVV
ncbi:MAG: dephospho-CoA kinase [Armatimonadetes bacterium]|nr:dephospho-CoA kinase [Armatimonadota bacterium]